MSESSLEAIAGLPPCLVPRNRLGRVVSVSGGRVIALLEGGHALQIGALVKLPRPGALVFGLIEGLKIPTPGAHAGEGEQRLAEITLVGEITEPGAGGTPAFRRGVSGMPCLDDSVLGTDSADTRVVYALPDRQVLAIGTVHADPSVAAYIGVDDLLGRHFAIVGATGSGKSTALASLLHGILELNPIAHILLLDPHGEYGHAFGDRAESLTVERLRIPFWILEFDELVEILFGPEKDASAAEIAILRRLVLKARLAYAEGKRDLAGITVDTPVPYTMSELSYLLDQETGRLDNQASLGPFIRLKNRLASVQSDPRFAFLFPRDFVLRDDLAAILGQLFRIPTDGKPLCTLDLSRISSEILNAVVAVISRLAFSVAVLIGQQAPILLVCEEAHRYAPQDTGLGFEPAKRALARIAKEGRKYGISLGLLSQRPSELSVSILSQCSTVMAFRMVNAADQGVIAAALSDISSALVDSLPLLGTGEAVIVGEATPIPMRLRLAHLPPDRRPRSNSASFSRLWQQDDLDPHTLHRIVEEWRGPRT